MTSYSTLLGCVTSVHVSSDTSTPVELGEGGREGEGRREKGKNNNQRRKGAKR